jgi:membrane-bound ClpP family serine protease
MVDKDMILVLRDGAIVELENESQIRLKGQNKDQVIASKGKLLTLDASQMIEYGVADLVVAPVKTPELTGEQHLNGKYPATALPLFHQPFFEKIPNAEIDEFKLDWKMQFFTFLASPLISSLLFLGMMIGFYLEFSVPGHAASGTIGATCLFLIVLSSFSLEIANWLELILLLVGLAVVLVELFVLPTFGLLGVIGLISFLAGLFGMMLPGVSGISFEFDTQTFNAAGEAFFERLGLLSLTFLIGVALIMFLSRYFVPALGRYSRLVLHGNEQVGFFANVDPHSFPPIGSIGVALTTLRPAGKVVIQEKQYDALSQGALVEKGHPVEVIGIDGGALIVKDTIKKE